MMNSWISAMRTSLKLCKVASDIHRFGRSGLQIHVLARDYTPGLFSTGNPAYASPCIGTYLSKQSPRTSTHGQVRSLDSSLQLCSSTQLRSKLVYCCQNLQCTTALVTTEVKIVHTLVVRSISCAKNQWCPGFRSWHAASVQTCNTQAARPPLLLGATKLTASLRLAT